MNQVKKGKGGSVGKKISYKSLALLKGFQNQSVG